MISETINRYSIVSTADGSYTLYDHQYGAHFHSLHGALTESRHVYLNHGLEYYIHHFGIKNPIRIFEFGFGTGMNALLADEYANANECRIEYISLEKHILPREIVYDYIHYHTNLMNVDEWMHIWENIEKQPYENKFFSLKIWDTWSESSDAKWDVFFWDAFGPGHHADAWTIFWLDKVKKAAARPCVLSTFCAQGQFKRNLKSLGFEVLTVAGPKGKKEITVAVLHQGNSE
jgi:tRNA U34 5-methylaminomethyl-2-thiouridine-forming methyltransferase MnmC